MTPISRWTRLHHLLGRCSWCWRRSSFHLTMQGRDENDEPVGDALDYHLCPHHADEVQKATLPVAESIGLTFENGAHLRFPGPMAGQDAAGPERGLPFCPACGEEFWTDEGSLYCPCEGRGCGD